MPSIGRLEPIAPAGLRGDANTLRINMGLDRGRGYQDHHLIMTSEAKNSSALQYLAGEGLYDINRSSSGIRLPSDDFLALAEGSPLHRGFHGPEYRSAVSERLELLDAAYDSRRLTNEQLLQRVARMENRLADDLRNGRLWL
jgi:hypothetical protein